MKKNRLKHMVYDLSRINEWWLLSLGMIFFAFIPYTFNNNGDVLDSGSLMGLMLNPQLHLSLLIVFSAQIFLFASNDYFDRDVDSLDQNKKMRNPVCNGAVTLPGVRALLVVTGLIPLLASLYFGLLPFMFTALAMFVFYFYTAPPLRFKNKFMLDVITHGMFVNTFPYFFCLVALNDFTIGTLYLLSVLIMRSTIAQIFQEIRDYEVDRQVEKNTVVRLGQRTSLRLAFAVYVALFLVTVILTLSFQIWGVGIDLYYILILILCFTYIPIFHKLFKVQNLGKYMERLWMGQGRTNLWQIVQYVSAFALYIVIMYILWHVDYF